MGSVCRKQGFSPGKKKKHGYGPNPAFVSSWLTGTFAPASSLLMNNRVLKVEDSLLFENILNSRQSLLYNIYTRVGS